jgi:site-specific DNA-cytosine methylase
MGSGLDGFFAPVKSASATVEYVLQADVDPKRAAVLLAAHGVAASYSSAAAAARDFRGELDVLTMTAPCQLLSQMRRVRPEEAEELAKRAEAQTRSAWEAFSTIVRRCRPRVVMMEQVASMQSHNRALYTWFNARLAELPYSFAHGVVDAASELHAAHSRKRLGWVGVADGA